MPQTRTYAGEDAATRREARQARLLEAALELLGTKGATATTVRGTCKQAGLTERYFYESFADLDALLSAVFDELVTTATTHMLAAIVAAPDDAHAKATAAIGTFVQYVTDDPRRARVLFMEAWGHPVLAERRLQANALAAQLVAAQARAFYGDAPQDDPIADVTATMLVGGTAELLIRWLDGTLAISREELIETLTELFVSSGETALAIANRRTRT